MALDVAAPSTYDSLLDWINDAVSLCDPDDVHWCDGSTEEYERLCALLVHTGTFERLSEELRPNLFDMGDYFRHWLRIGRGEGASLPRIFSVNWFRKSDGRWLWPGFGENARVLEWVHRRCDGRIEAINTPIGLLPAPGGLNGDGPSIDAGDLDALLRVDPDGWLQEIGPIRDFYASLGDSLPAELRRQLDALERRLHDGRRRSA